MAKPRASNGLAALPLIIPDDLRQSSHARRLFEQNFESRPIAHENVCALLLSWDPTVDDLKVKPEVDALHDVLEGSYGFHVEKQYLEDQKTANVHVSQWIKKYDAKKTLLILYYAGHGYCEDGKLRITGRAGQELLSDSVKRNNDSIAYNVVENLLRGIDSDVLVIFDCCEAGSLAGPRGRGPHKRLFEFLAACSGDEWAKEPGEHSFTSAMIQSLKDLREEKKPFTSRQLLERIQAQDALSKQQTPILVNRTKHYDDNVWIAPLNETSVAEQGHYQLEHEYMDVRLHYSKKLCDRDIVRTAKGLSHLVRNGLSGLDYFPVRNITMRAKTSHKDAITPVVEHWKDFKRQASDPSPPTGLSMASASGTAMTAYEDHGYLSPGTGMSTYPESEISEAESNAVTFVSETTRLLSTSVDGVLHEQTTHGILRKTAPHPCTDAGEGMRHHFRMLVKCAMAKLRSWFTSFPKRAGRASILPA